MGIRRPAPCHGRGLVITRATIERRHGSITLPERRGPDATWRAQLPTKPA
jgi:sensor histidine kinase regulating citrate/malate metabolism